MNDNFFRGLKFALPISLIMWVLFALLMLSLFGCAAMVPNYVAPELEHMSHATQHLGGAATNYGANIASVTVGYNLPHHLNVELSEGISLDRRWSQSGEWGEIKGPREQFSVRVRYMVQLRK